MSLYVFLSLYLKDECSPNVLELQDLTTEFVLVCLSWVRFGPHNWPILPPAPFFRFLPQGKKHPGDTLSLRLRCAEAGCRRKLPSLSRSSAHSLRHRWRPLNLPSRAEPMRIGPKREAAAFSWPRQILGQPQVAQVAGPRPPTEAPPSPPMGNLPHCLFEWVFLLLKKNQDV